MKLIDKIKGAVFGTAYGDALGLGTEFMTRREADSYYPTGLRHFDDIINDSHRSQWQPGEYTNDTELFAIVAESAIARQGYDLNDIAERIQRWFVDKVRDIAPVINTIISDSEWVKNPLPVAADLWAKNGFPEASNEALQRAVLAGVIGRPDEVLDMARELVLITHVDGRCVASGVMVALAANSLLHTGEMPEYDYMAHICEAIDVRVLPYLEIAYRGQLEDLQLDDPETLAWTRKCMASALWVMWHLDDPAVSIHLLVDAAGDANTNAALAGTLVGLKYGFDAIPEEKSKLVEYEYLDDLSTRLAEFVASINPDLAD